MQGRCVKTDVAWNDTSKLKPVLPEGRRLAAKLENATYLL